MHEEPPDGDSPDPAVAEIDRFNDTVDSFLLGLHLQTFHIRLADDEEVFDADEGEVPRHPDTARIIRQAREHLEAAVRLVRGLQGTLPEPSPSTGNPHGSR